MKKTASLLFLCLSAFLMGNTAAFSQLTLINEIKPPSAQAAQFNKYGKYNPQLYTGKISVSIPIYVYKDKDFTIPVTLDYSYNGLVANTQAGETGLGWSLGCGGYITREVKGIPDEEMGSILLGQGGMSKDLYGFDDIPFTSSSSFHNNLYYQCLIDNNTGPGKVPKIFYSLGPKYYEATPDIYHFSFLGRSGSFIRDTTGKFIVFHTSTYNGDYKIEKSNKEVNGINNHLSQIIITTGDGYKYYFGSLENNYTNKGINLYPTTDRTSVPKDETNTAKKDILSWKLIKIVAPSGRSITFDRNINKGGITKVWNYRPSLWNYGYNLVCTKPVESKNSPLGEINATADPFITESCPLSEVDCGDNEIITFSYASKPADKRGEYITNNGIREINGTYNVLQSIEWNDSEADMVFTYNETGNPYPFLDSVHIKGIGTYTMEYKGLENGYFPPNGTTATDYWDYANSTSESECNSNTITVSQVSTLSGFSESLQRKKEPGYSASSLGLMTKISYPTKGYTNFTYEKNNYSKRVSKESSDNYELLLHDLSGTGPGARIKKITNCDNNGVPRDSVIYNYVNSDGSSSGVLLKYPRCRIQYSGVFADNCNITCKYATSGGLVSYDAVPVEYPRVEEILSDGSKNIYHFSNWQTDCDTKSNFYVPMRRMETFIGTYKDYLIMSSADSLRVCNILSPYESKQSQRGKLLKKETYGADNSGKLECIVNRYNTAYPLSSKSDRICVGEGYLRLKLYTDDYPLVSTEDVSYYPSDSVENVTNYTYNSYGQKIKESRQESNGDIYSTYYTYVTDISPSSRTTVERAMYEDHVIGYPVDVSVKLKKKGETAETIVSEDKYIFEKYYNSKGDEDLTIFYRPKKQQKRNVLTGAFYTYAEFLYDNQGDMIEKKDANGLYSSYIWSGNGLGVAIKVANASNAQIKAISGLSNVFNSYPVGVSDIKDKANTIKTALNKAEVSWYTYVKYGMPSKISDPSGKIITYTYDANDRLTGVTDSGESKTNAYTYNTITK
ncbi:MAG: RHS repeat protein [Bacteroidales bacterium]|jgi:YD repeat-containing protein|nr:RHS repeat protein [Bacteroidales bacterium]